ncbi:MAG: aminoacyl--tRNA ligase-related protein [Candidatus Aenigmatarchaeota archaeon]
MADFNLECSIEFNVPIENILKEKFPILVAKEVNPVLFRKGVPEDKEGSRIVDWSIVSNKLNLLIEGSSYLRPHDALLRLRNYFIEKLGKERIGVRGIFGKKYTIFYTPTRKPLDKIEIKVPWVKNIDFDGKAFKIVLENLDAKCFEDRYVERILKRIEEKIAKQYVHGKAGLTQEIKRSEKRIEKYVMKKDISEILEEIGWAKKFSLSGIWGFSPPIASLIRAIEALIIKKVIKPMKFEEILLPRLIPFDTEYKKGHLAIPNEIFWVCPPFSRESEYFDDFIDYVEITQEIPTEILKNKLDKPIAGLAYAQCEGFYQLFEKKVVDIDKPLRFFDRFGPTWRAEFGGVRGLERLDEFYRMELMYLGSPEFVKDTRDEILNRTVEIVDKIFDLEWKIEKTIPIYLEHSGKVEEEKEEFVKTYDLSILLPFETLSRKEKELEIASFHIHKDFYAERFKYKERKNRIVWTGCTGLGITRFAYVFLIRYGFDFKEWPLEIKKIIKKMPNSLKNFIVE